MIRWLAGLALPAAAIAALGAGQVRADESSWPAVTNIGKKGATLPGQVLGGVLVVEAKGGRSGTYHFLVDTAASRSLVSPDLAAALQAKGPPPVPAEVPVRAADGRITLLPAAVLTRLNLGGARFDDVPVLVYDCSALSDDFGVRIDGILGYSLFHDAILTLDYPRSQVILRSLAHRPPPAGSALALNRNDTLPTITVLLGDRPLPVLIDSGKDMPMSLNRQAQQPGDFALGPVPGPTVHDLVGDHRQRLGRLSATLHLGDYAVPRPVVEVSDERSSIGGGVLKNFVVTFDQQQGEVYFQREASDPIAIPGSRTTGLSFNRTPAYWRVASVIPGSPAEKAGISEGDLVTKVEGDPVAKWDKPRYDRLLANAERIRFTFLEGTQESDRTLPVTDLVP